MISFLPPQSPDTTQQLPPTALAYEQQIVRSGLDVSDVLNIEEMLVAFQQKFLTFNFKRVSPFSERLSEIRKLQENWDGYGAYAPAEDAIENVSAFLEVLPASYLKLLGDECVFPNPHGTVSLEWRKQNHVISLEFGSESASFYSIVNESVNYEEELASMLSSTKLINELTKFASDTI